MSFENREHAARLLARRLSAYYKNKNPLVLAIPRGAIGMAEIIADVLGGELDVVLVHKLGAPGQPELAIGAIDETGNVFLSAYGLDIDSAYLEAEKQAQLEVLRKTAGAIYTVARAYRPTRPYRHRGGRWHRHRLNHDCCVARDTEEQTKEARRRRSRRLSLRGPCNVP
jgi:predicted phosphoribosyltransferase